MSKTSSAVSRFAFAVAIAFAATVGIVASSASAVTTLPVAPPPAKDSPADPVFPDSAGGEGDAPAGAANNTNQPLVYGNANITPIPEPATWATLSIGFIMVGAVRRRRRIAVAA